MVTGKASTKHTNTASFGFGLSDGQHAYAQLVVLGHSQRMTKYQTLGMSMLPQDKPHSACLFKWCARTALRVIHKYFLSLPCNSSSYRTITAMVAVTAIATTWFSTSPALAGE